MARTHRNESQNSEKNRYFHATLDHQPQLKLDKPDTGQTRSAKLGHSRKNSIIG